MTDTARTIVGIATTGDRGLDPGVAQPLGAAPCVARIRGTSHEDASDLTQAFFVHLLESHALRGVGPAFGRFRAFLLASFKHFQCDAFRRARARKRGGGLTQMAWDTDVAERYQGQGASDADPERLFARQWALATIDRARGRLAAEYAAAGRSRTFEQLLPHLVPDEACQRIAELARAPGTSDGAARVTVHRVRRRFGVVLRAEVASTLSDAGDVDSELRFLLDVLGGGERAAAP